VDSEPLPPLREIFRSAVEDLKLEIPKKGERTRRPEETKPRRPKRRKPAVAPKEDPPPPPPSAFGRTTARSASPRGSIGRIRAERKAKLSKVTFEEPRAPSKEEPKAKADEPPADGETNANEGDSRDTAMITPSRRHHLLRGSSVVARKFLQTALTHMGDGEEKEEEDFFWDESELRNVFIKFDFDKDGELHRDQLPAVLSYLWARPEPGDVERILEEQTPYATLSWQEFREFLTKYREIDKVRSQRTFQEADDDDSGFLEFDELHSLLVELGYSASVETTIEAFRALEKNITLKLNFREYEGLREHLRLTEGFGKADVKLIRELYDKVGLQNHSGHERIVTEIWRLVMHLGYPASLQFIETIVKEVDADDSGVICFPEMLKVIRFVRDAERRGVAQLMEKYGQEDEEGDRRVLVEDLCVALGDLNYFLPEEAATEILTEMDDFDEDDENGLTSDQIHSFLRGYRHTDGLSESEVTEFEEVFEKEGKRHPDALHTLEVGPVLRWFGFARTLQQVQRLVEEVDFDDSGLLEFPEFRKLMRRLHQDEAQRRRQVFNALDTGRAGKILVSSLTTAIAALVGTQPDPALLQEALSKATGVSAAEAKMMLAPHGAYRPEPGGMHGAKNSLRGSVSTSGLRRNSFQGRSSVIQDIEMSSATRSIGSLTRRGFEAIWSHYNRLAVQEVRSKFGYNAAEVAKLSHVFHTFDKDKSGTVEQKELSKMIAEYFPDATKSKQGQQDIQRALSEVDRNGDGELDFMEFLNLMRKCDDMRDKADMEQEQAAVVECGLSPEEVDGFRQIFSAHVDWRGELDLRALAGLLSRVVDLSEEEAQELERVVREVHPHSRDVARFPQFLRLIKRLTQDNYGGVNNAAARLVKRQRLLFSN
jgi:Ca2+-binding EF-hand superfamily protein